MTRKWNDDIYDGVVNECPKMKIIYIYIKAVAKKKIIIIK